MLYLLFLSAPIVGQNFEWVYYQRVKYQSNPDLLKQPVAFSEGASQLYYSRPDSVLYIYGQHAMGRTAVECRDTLGMILWSKLFVNKVEIQQIATDASGNVYVAGIFEDDLIIGGTDTMPFVTGGFIFNNTFICMLDPNGNLIWKRNLTSTWPSFTGVEALSVSPSGEVWYGLCDFFDIKLVSIDVNGNDNQVRTIGNGKTLGAIAFDPAGGMYVSGATEQGNYVMDGTPFYAPHDYNMSLAYYNPSGQAQWALFGYDITFQRPMITTDPLGNVFFVCNHYDSATFGNFYFHNPYMASDFLAFKADNSGNVLWGLQQPPLLIGPFGRIDPGNGLNVSSDAAGNFFMASEHWGTVDWGNGFISGLPLSNDRRISVAWVTSSGSVNREKMGGSQSMNFANALVASQGGSVYFTGLFSDTASFESIVINTPNFVNACVGKISYPNASGIESPESTLMDVYPIPSSGSIWISLLPAEATATVTDSKGSVILNKVELKNHELDIHLLPPGLYFLNVQGKDYRGTAKFISQ